MTLRDRLARKVGDAIDEWRDDRIAADAAMGVFARELARVLASPNREALLAELEKYCRDNGEGR